ncbi:solute carrier family 23 protein, partial [Kocuria subflava]
FAQNVGVIAMTGIKSRFVVVAGGGMLVLLGLLPVLGRVIASVPYPVLGGVGIVLFGSVAASGIRMLTRIDWAKNTNQLIVATSIAMGVIPIAMPTFYAEFPEPVATVSDSGISAAAITAFALNLLFHHVMPASSHKVDDRRHLSSPAESAQTVEVEGPEGDRP